MMRAMPFDLAAVTAPFRMQPGLRRIAAGASQLTPNRPGARHLEEKLAVLSAHAPQALAQAPGFDPEPALHALLRHAVHEHPDAVTSPGAQSATALHLGWSVQGGEVIGDGQPEIGACLCALPAPWRGAGLLSVAFAEDFAVLDAGTGRIDWMAVCLPSHWAPEDKVGRHFAQVHAPVADNALLIAAAEPLMRLVTGDERWERFVWTLTPWPRLDAHPTRTGFPAWPVAEDLDQLAARTFLRSERQTFTPVPDARQAVFTIHVELHPLTEVAAAPEAAARLHAALGSMSPAVLAYRRLEAVREPLLAWLARRADSPRA